ncbi:hypothetical protein T484DRAFT_1903144, partial [Baffinella frigidus]
MVAMLDPISWDPLPAGEFRWRNFNVRIRLDRTGRKTALENLETGEKLHKYAARTAVYLRGHEDVTLEDFPLERRSTGQMGVYRWRDRTVRVLFDVGRKDRIIDVDDGSVVHQWDEEDLLTAGFDGVDADMRDDDYFAYDRPAALIRIEGIADKHGEGGAPFGPIRVVWPEPVDGNLMHGGTIFWFPGMGGSSDKNVEQLREWLCMPWVKIVFVEPPVLPVAAMNSAAIPAWCGLDKVSDKADAGEDEAAFNRSMTLATALVQDEIASGTHPNEIILCGLGQGAGVAIAAGLNSYAWDQLKVADDDDEHAG